MCTITVNVSCLFIYYFLISSYTIYLIFRIFRIFFLFSPVKSAREHFIFSKYGR